MAFRSGLNSDAKKLLMRLPEEKGDDRLYMLNYAQIKALLSLSQSISWRTRHTAFPDYVDTQDKLQAFADETSNDLMSPVDFCSEITACADEIIAIITDALSSGEGLGLALQNAIKDMLLSSDDFIQNITNITNMLTQAELNGELVGGSCDWSVVAGKAIAIVERFDQNNLDALESVAVATNDEMIVSNLIEGVPLLGELPFDDIIEFGAVLVLDFVENYSVASTIARKDDMARDLWCFMLSQPDCAVSYLTLFQFFQTRATTGLDQFANILDIINFVRDGDFDNDQLLFDTMFATQAAFLNAARDFYGVNVPKIGALTRDAEPSSVWIDWDGCVAEETCEGGTPYNWIIHEYGWLPWFNRAIWEDGLGWKYNPLANGTRIAIVRNLSIHPTRMRVWLSHAGQTVVLYAWVPDVSTISLVTMTYVGSDALGHMYQASTVPAYTGHLMIELQGLFTSPPYVYIRRACVNYDV